MTSLILFILAICSFLFYGVVGDDKTWLLAPVYLCSYIAITIALLRRALGDRHQASGRLSTSNIALPTSGSLFILFLLWGIAMIPQAAVPFESKLVTLFVGAVIGAYVVWGSELTAFKDNRLLLGILIFVVMLLALYGLIIHFRSPQSILWTERYTDAYEGRLRSTYICPNHFAHLMQMLMPFCVALLFIPQAGIFLRFLSLYSFGVFLFPLFLTESRAGWLGAIAAVGATVCLMALRRSKKLFFLLILLVPLCSILLLLGAWRFSETFQRRAAPVVQFMQGQAEGGVGSEAKDFRPQTWMDTIDMIKEAPLFGFGPGNYRYTYPEHRKRFRGTRIVTGHPHNEYLELIADYGLIGFGLFALAWCYGLMRVLIASLRATETRHAFIGFAFLGTAAGTMVHSFFDFQMHVFPNALVFAFLAAVAIGPLFHARRGALKSSNSLKSSNVNGDATALEYGDSSPLSGSYSHERARRSDRYHQQQTTSNEQTTSSFSPSKKAEKETSATNRGSVASPNSKLQTANYLLRRTGSWLIAIGYLLLTVLCLQVMLSSYIRALGDKAAKKPHPVSRPLPRAKQMYNLAAKIDPQNWRAYKGIADQLYTERYYSIDRAEKLRLAEQERSWYEKTYLHNPKDPQTVSALGKCLIFLGKGESTGQGSDSIYQSPGGTASSPSADNRGDDPPAQHHSPEEKIEQGLALLREACTYRPFNDVYWWNLGVELRKLGRYEDALEIFQIARSIKNTASTRANIKWIEQQRSEVGGQRSENEGLDSSDVQPQTLPEWELPDIDNAPGDTDLMNLFERMGN